MEWECSEDGVEMCGAVQEISTRLYLGRIALKNKPGEIALAGLNLKLMKKNIIC